MERELETAKATVAMRPDFNLYDAFKVFDSAGGGSIRTEQIVKGLELYGVYAKGEETDLIVKRYDNNGDGTLVFHEFCAMFIPMDHYLAQELDSWVQSSHNYPPEEIFASLTRDYFTALLRFHVNIETYAEQCR